MGASSDLSFQGSTMWDRAVDPEWDASRYDDIEMLAVDYCTMKREVELFRYRSFEIGSQRWDAKKAITHIRDDPNPNPLSRSFEVLVKIRVNNTSRLDEFGERVLEILADGVYFPATGKMHLVGCIRGQHLPDFSRLQPPVVENAIEDSPDQEQGSRYDPGFFHAPPLNSLPLEDCAISAMVQYPPLLCRWNSERILKYSIPSNREKNDSLYFEPIERTGFFPYLIGIAIQSQKRLEAGVRILLLILGLLSIALQISHGKKNEESLPFVSLVMLAIQLAHHVSQMSSFKDHQIDHDGYGHFSRPFSGMTDVETVNYNFHRERSIEYPDAFPPYLEDAFTPFVSSRFYDLSKAQWGFVNKLTGLVVSFFLVPQLVGNMQWELQGRPLSVWFYAGIPFLQSLPHVFTIAKHFQVLPIFSFYDPYMNFIYGIYEKETPWWQVRVVSCSALLVLAVHSQFARSLHGSGHSTPKTTDVQNKV